MNPPPGPGPNQGQAQRGHVSLTPSGDPSPRPGHGTTPTARRTARHRGAPERMWDQNPAPPGKPAAAGDGAAAQGLGGLGWAMGCSQLPHSPELRARARQEWAPGPTLDGRAAPLSPAGTWREELHLGGGAPGRGGPPSQPCQVPPTGCSPQRGPGELFPAPPQLLPGVPSPAELWPGPGPSSCGAWLSGTGKTRCAHTFQGPPVPSGCGLRAKAPLHARRCTPRYPSPHLTLTMAGVQCDCPAPSVSSSLWGTDCVQTRGEALGPAKACSLRAHFTNEETDALSSLEWQEVTRWILIQVRPGSHTFPSQPLSGPQSPCL